MNFLRQHIVFFILLFATALLRLLPLFEYQFTYDELSGLDRTQFNSFEELIQKGVKIDAHPALVQVIIYCIVKIFGFESWALKLPFLLFSLGTIVFGYATGLNNFSKKAGNYAAAFFSFSLVFVFHAPVARMYSSGVFFSTAVLFYFLEIFHRGRHKILNYVLLGAFALLSAFNHHMNALFVASVFACVFLFISNLNRLKFGITCLVCVFIYAFHLPLTLYQVSIGGIGVEQGGWLEKPDWYAGFELIKILLGTSYCWILILLLVAEGMYLDGKGKFSRVQWMLLVIFIVNYLVVYVYSLLRAPVYQVSVILFAGAAFVLLVSSLLPDNNKINFRIAFTILTAMLLYQTYIKKDYLNESVKTVFDYQFERTIHYKKIYGEQEVFPIFFDADTLMKKIYFKKYKTKFKCLISSDPAVSFGNKVYYPQQGKGGDTVISSIKLFSELVRGLKENYIVLSSSTPLYQAIVKEYFPYLTEDTQTQGIHFQLYSKIPPKKETTHPDLYYSDPAIPGAFSYRYHAAKNETEKKRFHVGIDSADVFPFSATADYRNVITAEGEFILTSAVVEFGKYNGGLESCVVINNNADNTVSYNARAASDYILRADSSLVIYSDAYIGNFHRKNIPGKKVNCYLWNKSGETAVLLNFNIKVIDHWHNKWHFWD